MCSSKRSGIGTRTDIETMTYIAKRAYYLSGNWLPSAHIIRLTTDERAGKCDPVPFYKLSLIKRYTRLYSRCESRHDYVRLSRDEIRNSSECKARKRMVPLPSRFSALTRTPGLQVGNGSRSRLTIVICKVLHVTQMTLLSQGCTSQIDPSTSCN